MLGLGFLLLLLISYLATRGTSRHDDFFFVVAVVTITTHKQTRVFKAKKQKQVLFIQIC